MNSSVQEIQSRIQGHSKTWLLPPRESSSIRGFAWSALVTGVLTNIFMSVWALGMLVFGVLSAFQFPVFVVFPLCMLWAARNQMKVFTRDLWFAIKLLRDKSCIELKIEEGQLSSVEKLGWLDSETKIPLNGVSSFSVERTLAQDHLPVGLALGPECHVRTLVAHYQSGTRIAVASAYPKQLLLELAKQLSVAIGMSDSAQENAKPVAVLKSKADFEDVQIVKEQPPNSKILVHESGGDSVTYEIPRIGFTDRARASLVFSTIWCGFFSLFLSGSIASCDWWSALFAIPFLLLGIVMLSRLVQGIYRKTIIGIMGDQLFVDTKSLFQNDWLEYHRDDIRAVLVGDGEISEDRRPIKELHVLMRDEKCERLLPLLSEPELDWLAFSLSHDLGLQFGAEKLDWKKELNWSSEESNRALSASSAKVLQAGKEISITVPSKWKHDKVEWYFSALFLAGLAFLFSFLAKPGVVYPIVATVGSICCLAVMLEHYTQEFLFTCSAKHLKLVRKSVFMRRKFLWGKHHLETISVQCDSEVPLESSRYYLAIEDENGIFSLLSGRPRQRLADVAASLSAKLDLAGDKADHAWPSGGVSQSLGSGQK